VAARVIDMFLDFYLEENHRITNNSATTEAREKINQYLEFLELYNFFDSCSPKFERNKVLLNKISR
jgi:hypothetical protein